MKKIYQALVSDLLLIGIFTLIFGGSFACAAIYRAQTNEQFLIIGKHHTAAMPNCQDKSAMTPACNTGKDKAKPDNLAQTLSELDPFNSNFQMRAPVKVHKHASAEAPSKLSDLEELQQKAAERG